MRFGLHKPDFTGAGGRSALARQLAEIAKTPEGAWQRAMDWFERQLGTA